MNFLIGVFHEETALDANFKLSLMPKLFPIIDFSNNHLECILEKFFEAFDLFQTFLSVEFEKTHDYTFELFF